MRFVLLMLLSATICVGCVRNIAAPPSATNRLNASGFPVGESAAETIQQLDGAIVPAVLFPKSAVSDRYRYPLAWGDPVWSPSKSQVIGALEQIPSLLTAVRPETGKVVSANRARYLPQLRANFTNSVCQVVGVTIGQEKALWLNFLPKDDGRFTQDWQTKLVEVFDGGPRYWSVVYLLGQNEFMRLRIDLGF
jgi:hypothetical protein